MYDGGVHEAWMKALTPSNGTGGQAAGDILILLAIAALAILGGVCLLAVTVFYYGWPFPLSEHWRDWLIWTFHL